mgnify:CR=1 FL=1
MTVIQGIWDEYMYGVHILHAIGHLITVLLDNDATTIDMNFYVGFYAITIVFHSIEIVFHCSFTNTKLMHSQSDFTV